MNNSVKVKIVFIPGGSSGFGQESAGGTASANGLAYAGESPDIDPGIIAISNQK